MAAIRKITKDFKSFNEFKEYIAELSKEDNFAWVGEYIFGRGFISAYQYPSKIPYNAVGDTAFNGTQGYYKNGKHHKFSDKKKIKYDSSCLGCE